MDTALRLAATTLGIKKLEANGGRVIFRPKPNVEPLTIIKDDSGGERPFDIARTRKAA